MSFLIPSIVAELILTITAVVLVIFAMRDEERNWRHIFVLIVGIFFIVIEIFTLLYYEEILLMLEEFERSQQT